MVEERIKTNVIILSVIVICVMTAVCAVLFQTISNEDALPSDEAAASRLIEDNAPLKASPAITPTVTDILLPTNTPQPQVTDTPGITAGLPGLNPADITISLEDNGLSCSGVESLVDGYVRTCTKDTGDYSMRVDIYSWSGLFNVDYVDAGIIFFADPDDTLASSFLGFLATAPYDNAEPDAAREWVESNLRSITAEGDVREATFGGAEFFLFGPPTTRFLEFGDPGDEY